MAEGKPKLVALTGAGISAESGLNTFRDSGGLWENHRIEDVATNKAWLKNQNLVLEFYNQRRKQALNAQPNRAHFALKELESKYDVTVITQNVDNLHEKAGSSHVLHLHGDLFKCRSTMDESLVYEMQGWELKSGDLCEKGSQLRPHIVWFGEPVPMMDEAIQITIRAEIFLIIGTSMAVYPAAGLISYTSSNIPVYVVDPNLPIIPGRQNLKLIGKKAGEGMEIVLKNLL